jgi:hypothetical protein
MAVASAWAAYALAQGNNTLMSVGLLLITAIGCVLPQKVDSKWAPYVR